MDKYAFEDDVRGLAEILPDVGQGWSFENLQTVSDVFAFREEVRQELDRGPKMFKMHVTDVAALPPNMTTYVSGLYKDRVITLQYQDRIVTQWLVSRGLEKQGRITPASNTGVENDPQA